MATAISLLATACSGPMEVRNTFSRDGEVIALSGGSGGATNACVSCHGIKGEGNGNLSPRLNGLDPGYIARQLRFYVDGQRVHPRMVAVAKALTPDERARVATYCAKLPETSQRICASAPAAVQALYRRGDPSRRIASCASCHGAAGEGNAGNPPLAGQPAPYLERQLADWRTGNRYGDPMNIMTRIAKALTPAESASLSAYAARLPGGPGYPESSEECLPARRSSPRTGA